MIVPSDTFDHLWFCITTSERDFRPKMRLQQGISWWFLWLSQYFLIIILMALLSFSRSVECHSKLLAPFFHERSTSPLSKSRCATATPRSCYPQKPAILHGTVSLKRFCHTLSTQALPCRNRLSYKLHNACNHLPKRAEAPRPNPSLKQPEEPLIIVHVQI